MAISSPPSTTFTHYVGGYCLHCPKLKAASGTTANLALTVQGLKSLFEFVDFDYSQSPSYSQYIQSETCGDDGNQDVLEVIAKALCRECSDIVDLFGRLFAKYGQYCYLAWGCILMTSERLKEGRPEVLQSYETELRERIANKCDLKLEAKGVNRPMLERLIDWEMDILELLEEVDAYVRLRNCQKCSGVHPVGGTVDNVGIGATGGELVRGAAQEEASGGELVRGGAQEEEKE